MPCVYGTIHPVSIREVNSLLRADEVAMMLTFMDQYGTSWDVFEVYPTEERTVSRVPAAFRDGWLCFQSDLERRRLAPIPLDWRQWDVDRLLRRCSRRMGCRGERRGGRLT